MSIDAAYLDGEGWTVTFTLKNADGDIVDGSDVRVRFRRQHDGSEWVYLLGSDPQVTQTGSGVYVFEDATLDAGYYDVEWQSDGVNKERTRSTIRLRDEL